ncbi:MAG TPA: tetratricopeptide repeat protein [Syntrophorhabdaceae bacterium]|nr:tetratricopeptide repeat protein [Syntrophorhabdaceae bacterium]
MNTTALPGFLVLTVSVLLISSCAVAPYKAYTGPDLPPDETALIERASIDIAIKSCDGTEVTSDAVTVLPGDHTLEMSFNEVGRYYARNTCFLKFTVEAGHTYRIDKRFSSIPETYEGFVVDQNTGKQVVSGCAYIPGNEKQMLAFVEKSIKEHPKNATLWAAKGNVLFNLKKYDEALSAFETAISLNPDFADAWAMKSSTLVFLKRYDEALISVDKAIQLRPNQMELERLKDAIMKALRLRTAGSHAARVTQVLR